MISALILHGRNKKAKPFSAKLFVSFHTATKLAFILETFVCKRLFIRIEKSKFMKVILISFELKIEKSWLRLIEFFGYVMQKATNFSRNHN